MSRSKVSAVLQPSPEQEEILRLPFKAGSVSVIKAFAGSGKTATLRMIAEAHPEKRILYVVFNKAMAVEAAKTFPSNVHARTSHSLAFGVFGRTFGANLGPLRAKQVATAFGYLPHIALQVSETLQNWFHSVAPTVTEEHLPEECEEGLQVVDAARFTWRSMVDQTDALPMPHDGYQKLWSLSEPACGLYDMVFADEAHDLNPVVLDFVFRSASKSGAAVVFVGDSHQSIYSWRGAIDAVSVIEKRAESVSRLTWSFRFGENIARQASTILRNLKGETVGLVGAGKDSGRTDRFCVIGRTNFSLIEHALREAKAEPDIAIHFAATKATERWSPRVPYRFNDLLDVLSIYSSRPREVKSPYFRKFKSREDLCAFVEAGDKELEWLVKIVGEYGDKLPEILTQLEGRSVAPRSADITYSTAHRSKGLEWEYVQMLDDFADPSELRESMSGLSPAGLDLRKQMEEANLLYVAITRARRKVTVDDRLARWLSENSSSSSAGNNP
jgi:F-box protein 18 (helicase)